MLRRIIPPAVLVLIPSLAHAEEVELKNDGFRDMGQAACQQGFATGDEAAVTFSFPDDYTLERVRFLFCGADTTEMVTVRIYEDTGGAVPGTVLFEGDYQVTGSSEALTEIDLSAEDLVFSGGAAFRFALRLQHDGPPGLANDSDGATPGVNWIFDTLSSAWAESAEFGVSGDWIVRATIETEGGGAGGGGGGPGPTPASTSTMGSGGGGGAGGAGAGGDDTGDDEACSCSTVGGDNAPGSAWVVALGALAMLRRRKFHGGHPV